MCNLDSITTNQAAIIAFSGSKLAKLEREEQAMRLGQG
jgi:hypothetical protein